MREVFQGKSCSRLFKELLRTVGKFYFYLFTIINCVVLVYLFDNMSEINDHEGGTKSALHTNSGTETNWNRKLLTAKRLLIVNIKALITSLKAASASQLSDLVMQFEDIESSIGDFKERVNNNVLDPNYVSHLLEEINFHFEQCRKSLDDATRRAIDIPNENEFDDDLKPEDSVSQVKAPASTLSTTSKLLARKIEVERKRVELEVARDRDLANAKAEADAEARFRIQGAKLDAEEKLIALSEHGAFVASWLGSHSGSCLKLAGGAVTKSYLKTSFNGDRRETVKNCETAGPSRSVEPTIKFYPENQCCNRVNRQIGDHVNDGNYVNYSPRVKGVFDVINVNEALPRIASNTAQLCERPVVSSETSVFKEYLDRQGRNEYINLASQIGYDGHNIAFVFYENQIRKLMSESPCNERRLEILKASCAGQPRKMVNLFLAPMKSLSTSERIEKALDRLRQRYGVSGGLTTEPEIIDIRHGSKVVFNVSSLKSFNEDLNTLEVFAYAHDEVEKLSGQLLLDVASRLPGVLKRRYLDYLARMKLSLNRPGFDFLRNFIVHELSVMTSDYAQTFFKHDEKDTSKSSENGRRRGFARVRQVAVTSGMGQTKSLSLCFICSGSNSRHFIGDCELFKSLSNEYKKRSIIDAGRCLIVSRWVMSLVIVLSRQSVVSVDRKPEISMPCIARKLWQDKLWQDHFC